MKNQGLTANQQKTLDALVANGGNDAGLNLDYRSIRALKVRGLIRYTGPRLQDHDSWTGTHYWEVIA